jgi:hypothetical protein
MFLPNKKNIKIIYFYILKIIKIKLKIIDNHVNYENFLLRDIKIWNICIITSLSTILNICFSIKIIRQFREGQKLNPKYVILTKY